LNIFIFSIRLRQIFLVYYYFINSIRRFATLVTLGGTGGHCFALSF